MTHPLRIAFIHPDLGIGGAERLVVDAALGLTQLGHTVTIYTSFHTPARSFAETHDGTLQVRVLGGWLVPRSVFQRCVTICAVLRQLHLSLHLIYLSLSLFLSHQSVCDVFFVDQLSAAIPLLRYLTRTPVLFYGHFPDLLLSSDNNPSSSLLAKLKALYRLPLDWLEEYTTANADTILVNSHFTAEVFTRTLTSINKKPKVVYPGVDITTYDIPEHDQTDLKTSLIHSDRPTILSINRFERKKDINLILQAFIQLRKKETTSSSDSGLLPPRLVLAGGYDERLADNRQTLKALQANVPAHMSQQTLTPDEVESVDATGTTSSPDVLFLLNISHPNKLALLRARSTKLLGYTASNEHLGIGPLEGMACRLPVLAVDSGGPRETVDDPRTGFLVPPDPVQWAHTIRNILTMDDHQRRLMGDAGRERVVQLFSTHVMAKQFENTIHEIMLASSRRSDLWLEPGFFFLISFIIVPLLTISIGARQFL
ncbi:hypothetical protein PCANC_15739 [Puccinia coronata f. sp. avenae]|uniref:Alpha-1,3/1,6-mannosyltransferase ALG2 n=1 Tax=Puccinia coronata f. sp. avenae TaxID=200324 RepID=A0A2N5SW71_9BASI|nr:hypothetical protein PCANC_15739 [Puccinia coronata f. sp. avenae]PLW17488.1 hypothetical protein PCASD_16703 [Puccinia coronata f. sp. avenae]